MNEEDLKEYELAAITADAEAARVDLDKVLQETEILEKEPAKLVDLSYPIKKHRSATLFVYQFRARPEIVKKIQEALRFQTSVLRSMIITPPVKKQIDNQVSNNYNKPPLVNRPSTPEISSTEELTKTLESLESQT